MAERLVKSSSLIVTSERDAVVAELLELKKKFAAGPRRTLTPEERAQLLDLMGRAAEIVGVEPRAYSA